MTRKKKKIIYNSIVSALLLLGIYLVCSRFVHLGHVEFTDNAQVRRLITPVNSRVQGFVEHIYFTDYQYVHKGDTLAVIENTEYCLRLAQAEADLANAMAGHSVTQAGMETTQSNLNVNSAGIEEMRVQMENARRERNRYAQLLKEDAVTQQQYDNVNTAYSSALARYKAASDQRQSTASVKHVQHQQLGQSSAAIRLAQASVALARLNLSYTFIIATADGVTGKKVIHEGQLVQPGQTLADIVDSREVWVTANYRETQLTNLRVGQRVEIKADALPGIDYKGEVVSISEATGAAYSLVPQDNATGNFVKVEQRVPVRIALRGNSPKNLEKLRAGLNVECTVKIEKS